MGTKLIEKSGKIRLHDKPSHGRDMRSSLRLKHLAFSKLYRDNYPDLDRTVLVAGMARSGTTWLGNIIASQGANRLVFEPFNPSPVGPLHSAHYITYKRPDDEDPELEAYCSRVFSGDIRHRWIDQHIDHLRPKGRVVKAVRANLLLGWLRRNFPEVPQVLIIRHPCAVVSSWLQLGWTADRDIAAFLEQTDLVSDFLADRQDVIRESYTVEERIAIAWCINHLAALKQPHNGNLSIVYYEHLISQPVNETLSLIKSLGIVNKDINFDYLQKPSPTSRRNHVPSTKEARLEHWQYELNADQVARILRVVNSFGLNHLYGLATLPNMQPHM